MSGRDAIDVQFLESKSEDGRVHVKLWRTWKMVCAAPLEKRTARVVNAKRPFMIGILGNLVVQTHPMVAAL